LPLFSISPNTPNLKPVDPIPGSRIAAFEAATSLCGFLGEIERREELPLKNRDEKIESDMRNDNKLGIRIYRH
jgi:hypothetical protein